MNTTTIEPTYSFNEAIDRLSICNERWELELLITVISEEKRRYSLFHLHLLMKAIDMMREVVIK